MNRTNLMPALVLAACIASGILVGCEDGDSTKNEASVTTEELAGGSIKTTAREPMTLTDGSTVTQATTTITHPDGTTETSVSMDGASLSTQSDGTYSRHSRWVSVDDGSAELTTDAFPLRTIEFTNDYADPSQADQSSRDRAQDGTNDTPGGRWVVISEGISNSLEIQTYP
ncbi:MAG: hypothetical protein KJ626_06115 [Verrucomicrobia bacterium]|nr:hypothetical protein [Verrucomicrobiota bacterium]